MSFAQGDDDMTYPKAVGKLEQHLKDDYRDADWKPAFDAVFEAENDEVKAVESVHKLMESAMKEDVVSKTLVVRHF